MYAGPRKDGSVTCAGTQVTPRNWVPAARLTDHELTVSIRSAWSPVLRYPPQAAASRPPSLCRSGDQDDTCLAQAQ